MTRQRRILGRTGGRASIDPRRDHGNLLRRERWVIRELPVTWIGKPGRHLLRLHCLLDCRGPRLGLLVGHEGHRRYLAFAVTELTMVLQDGQDVFVEGRKPRIARSGSFGRSRNAGLTRAAQQKEARRSNHHNDCCPSPRRCTRPTRRLLQDLKAGLLALRLVGFVRSVAAQYLRKVLRERRARHHHVTSGFLCFHLQFALNVRQKTDDVGGLLEL